MHEILVMETLESLKDIFNSNVYFIHSFVQQFTHQQHVQQKIPHERLFYLLDLLNVVFDASPTQLNLHE